MRTEGDRTASLTQRAGIILKSAREIELMREAGRVVHRVHQRVREIAAAGVTTGELNRVAEALIAEAGGIALFKGVTNPQAKFPFPAALCTSVNEELVHGVPGDRVLEAGDVVSVDCGVRLNGYCGDAAHTLPIGEVSQEASRLLDVTRRALDEAINEIRPGRMWSEIAAGMQRIVEGAGFSVVRDFVGHGIGREMHEEPKVPNFWNEKQRRMDFELQPGLVLAIEPMVNAGTYHVEYGDRAGWVVVTRDRQYAAHFEHTVAVTQQGADVLTDGH
jgi:methionyl aminopeptidase